MKQPYTVARLAVLTALAVACAAFAEPAERECRVQTSTTASNGVASIQRVQGDILKAALVIDTASATGDVTIAVSNAWTHNVETIAGLTGCATGFAFTPQQWPTDAIGTAITNGNAFRYPLVYDDSVLLFVSNSAAAGQVFRLKLWTDPRR